MKKETLFILLILVPLVSACDVLGGKDDEEASTEATITSTRSMPSQEATVNIDGYYYTTNFNLVEPDVSISAMSYYTDGATIIPYEIPGTAAPDADGKFSLELPADFPAIIIATVDAVQHRAVMPPFAAPADGGVAGAVFIDETSDIAADMFEGGFVNAPDPAVAVALMDSGAIDIPGLYRIARLVDNAEKKADGQGMAEEKLKELAVKFTTQNWESVQEILIAAGDSKSPYTEKYGSMFDPDAISTAVANGMDKFDWADRYIAAEGVFEDHLRDYEFADREAVVDNVAGMMEDFSADDASAYGEVVKHFAFEEAMEDLEASGANIASEDLPYVKAMIWAQMEGADATKLAALCQESDSSPVNAFVNGLVTASDMEAYMDAKYESLDSDALATYREEIASSSTATTLPPSESPSDDFSLMGCDEMGLLTVSEAQPYVLSLPAGEEPHAYARPACINFSLPLHGCDFFSDWNDGDNGISYGHLIAFPDLNEELCYLVN